MINWLFKIGLLLPNLGLLTSVFKLIAARIRSIIQLINLKKSEEISPIIIFALPKSGSTWLEKMLADIPEYSEYMPWQAALSELIHGASTDYKLKRNHILPVLNSKAVIKVHSSFDKETQKWLINENIKFLVLTRDIEEAFESHYHYVTKTSFHPDYKRLCKMTKIEAMEWIKRRYSNDFARWVDNWSANISRFGILIDYQELINDTKGVFNKILTHLEIEEAGICVEEIIENNTLENLRKKSVQKDFFRGSKIV